MQIIDFSLYPYVCRDTIFQEYANISLGLGASVVALITNFFLSSKPKLQYSNELLFRSIELLPYLWLKGVAATGMVRANKMVNVPLRDLEKMGKEGRG